MGIARKTLGDMSMTHFDTLQYVKRAVAAGMEPKIAEFHAEELSTVINETTVTKTYFDAETKITRDHIDREIAGVKQYIATEIHRQILDLEIRLTWKFLGGIGLFLTLSQVIGHFFK